MSTLRNVLKGLTGNLSEKNYDETFAEYRLWFDIGTAHNYLNDENQVANDVRGIIQSNLLRPDNGDLIHPAIHLYLRFVGDIEVDPTMSAQMPKLTRSFEAAVDRCFEEHLSMAAYSDYIDSQPPKYQGNNLAELTQRKVTFFEEINLIACWANLGYVKRAVIRDHILQSLVSRPKLYDHQADAIIILFKVAGATFGTFADPSVVDRCLEVLKNHYSNNASRSLLVQVRIPHMVKEGHRVDMNV